MSLILQKGDITGQQTELNRINEQKKRYQKAADQLDALFKKDPNPTKLQMSLLKDMKEQATLAEPYIEKGLALALNNQPEEAYQYLRYEYNPIQVKWWGQLTAFIDDEESQNMAELKEAEEQYVAAKNTMVTLGLLALLVGSLGAWVIVRSLLKQLGGEPRYAVQIAEKLQLVI